jgi:hypothetical protein
MLEFQGYAYQEIFTAQEQDLHKKACELVAKVPYEIEGKTVRCHELVRAIGFVLGLDYTDGYYGMLEHSWLWLTPREEFCPPPRILDVYTPGRIPQVQIVDTSRNLPFEYRRGPCRTDLDESIITALYNFLDHKDEVSDKSTFGVAPYKPFPIEVTPVGQEGISVKGPGVDTTLCAHGANFLATKLIDAANKQCCDGYVHGDEDTMLLSPKVPNRPVTATDMLNIVDPLPKHFPTRETLDELLQKIQAFVQEHSNVEVIASDDAPNSLWGYCAYFVENGMETSIYESVNARDMKMSLELRAKVMPMVSTAPGRWKLAQDLMRGVKFV